MIELTGIKLKTSGESNMYWLMRDGNWVAKIQMNGEMTVAQQEAMLNAMLAAAPASPLRPAVPEDMRMVPASLLEELESSLYEFGQGRCFTSIDMDRYKRLGEVLSATPAAPSQPVTQGEPVAQVSDLFPSIRTKLYEMGFEPESPLYTAPADGPATPAATSQRPAVPEIDYEALIHAAFAKNAKWAQGTAGCIAFSRGAEWFRDQMLAAAPSQEPAVPQGWKLVPVEPTEEMLAAVSWPGCAHTDWSHMLAAAPTPPTPAAPSQEPAVNLSCKSTQARLAAQWGYVPAPSQPVTLTDGLIERGAMTGMVDAQIDSIIAAAPELLEALEAIIESVDAGSCAMLTHLQWAARAAIAKATGEHHDN